MARDKQKKTLSAINYQQQQDKGNNGSVPILMNSYQTIATIASRMQLKLNVIPTLVGSFEPKPLYLRTDPITERCVATNIPLDQVRSFIDMVHDYNVRRADVNNQFKSKNQNGPMIPLMVTKTQNDPNENICALDFFANSALQRFNNTFGKSQMVFQRYIPCKGANSNVIRCIWNKDKMQKSVYRIQTNVKMSGAVEPTEEEMQSPNKGHGSPQKKKNT